MKALKMTTEVQIRVAAYYRVSTSRQADADLSIPDQRRQAEGFATSKGWTIVSEFVDAGASGMSAERPELQRMLDFVTSSCAGVSVVLVHSFSRLYRDLIEFEFTLRRLRKHGVKLVSLTQDLGDDPSHDMIRKIITLFDEYQSRENAKHTKRAMIENARQGYWNGSHPPLGYRVVESEMRGIKAKKRLAIEPSEAAIVTKVFTLFLHGDGSRPHLGCKAIADHLNKASITTRQGGRFGVKVVHQMLTRSTYMGVHHFNRRDSRTGLLRPQHEQIEMSVPAIIDAQTFGATQTLLATRNPRSQPPRVVTGPILLTGLVRCADCAGAMTLRTGKSGRYRYYTCSTQARMGKSACPGRSMPMDKLDGLIVDHLERRLLTPSRLCELLSRLLNRRKEASEQLQESKRKLSAAAADAEAKIGRLYSAIEAGAIDINDDALRERIASLKVQKDNARAEVNRIEATLSMPTDRPDPAIYAKFADEMRTKLRSPDIEFRRAYLRLFTDRVEVTDHEVRIFGTTDRLLSAARSGGPGSVPSFIPKWRPLGDSNPCYRRERAVS
jgi:site-specific DNA recombinase